MTVKLRNVAIVLLLLAVLGAAGAALFVYIGIYNISATAQHTKPVYQLLEYAMLRSVKFRSDSVKVPDLSGEQRVVSGAVHYREHCLQCHGAPGVSPHDLAFGMTPEPVNLVITAREWKPAEIYWVVKHGIKMSGMPAWDYRLKDEEIWDTVAFVMRLPQLSPTDYAALDAKLPKAQEGNLKQAQTRKAPTDRPEAAQPTQLSIEKSPRGQAISDAGTSLPQPTPPDDPNPSGKLGDVKAGHRAIGQYLCATCHAIPGVVGASRHVGPPLKGIANRRYIGGILANNSENMVRWLMDPQHFDPLSAMPDLGVTEKDARDMAAYLYTLDDVN